MKNLFLYAKHLAFEENTDIITHQQLLKAVETIDFGNETIHKDIEEYVLENLCDICNVGGDWIVDEKIIQKAKELPRKDFDDKIKDFLSAMKEKGYELKGDKIPTKSYKTEKPSIQGQDMLKAAKQLKTNLADKLFGQTRAIDTVSDSIKNNILENETSTKATYLFLGPPATGKTYLAKLIGENLDNYVVESFDMTQYVTEKDDFLLFGLGRGYGDARPGKLTSFVKKYEKTDTKTIIVLDNFEKAHYNIQINFLEILSTGFKKDACGWCKDSFDDELTPWGEGGQDKNKCGDDEIDDLVDFRKTIVIFTSNLGKELYSDSKFRDLLNDNYIQAESMILDALRREKRDNNDELAISPGLVSNLSRANIVLFDKLNFQAYAKIAENSFVEYKDAFEQKYGIKFHISNNFKNFLKVQLLNFAPELDARRIKNKIGVIFFDRVTDHIMELDEGIDYCKELKVSISKEVNEFIKEQINSDIENNRLVKELFRKNLTLDIDDKFTSKDGVITYKIINCEFKQVKRIKDFSEDGLVFDVPQISFSDIAGHKKAKTRLSEVINFLKDPKLLEKFDVKAPKGMLLYGPPGTGKTMLAKAFANEAQLPFIATTGTDLLDADKTKAIFEKAKEYAPSIVFIDEIDALGKRGQGNSREIPINKLLSEMDGFSSNPDENVFVIAATNFKENIDSAIIRPGRIELHIEIDDLDKEARKYFIDQIIETKPISGKFDISKLLMYTTGMTGAQLELIGKESSLYCLRHGLEAITQEILIEQINTIKYGEKLSHLSLEQMIEETAIHEAGHAIISKILMPHIKIEQITVTPRGKALGFVSYNYEDAQNNMTVKDFKDRICVSMAGRVSQIKKYGSTDGVDTGAANDLHQATKDAYAAIAYYGMDEEVGYINVNGIINQQQRQTGISDTKHYHEEIDKAIKRWMEEAKNSTSKLVDEHWKKIEKLTSLLLDKEVVYEDELLNILKGN